MKPFRILILDDEVYKAAHDALSVNGSFPDFTAQQCGFVGSLGIAETDASPVEIVVAGDAALRKCIQLQPEFKKLAQVDNIKIFLEEFHVLVLDIRGIGSVRDPGNLTSEIVQKNLELLGRNATDPTDPDALLINEVLTSADCSGVAFYHRYLGALQILKAVIVLTVNDGPDVPAAIQKCLDPFCGDPNEMPAGVPWTIKFWKNAGPGEKIQGIIQGLYRDWHDGYVNLTNRGAIELAATHNLPIMIVGETGTGKEYIAKAIHRRWVQERRRKAADFPDRFVVVNCAGLTPELARSELFGHVAGSFTGATDHRIGAVLRACGCAGFKKDNSKRKDAEFQKSFESIASTMMVIDQWSNKTEQQKLQGFQAVFAELNRLFNPVGTGFAERWKESILGALNEADKRLRTAANGDDMVTDFYAGLMAKNRDLLDSLKDADGEDDDLGVCFIRKEPVGTLFLDEFAELPLEVQNLLLRFLEEKSGEIQPVGYTGRIAGLKVRLLIATSDPRVATFAGEKLTGAWRTTAELDRPLRYDLLNRVKRGVIRAAKVDAKNCGDTLKELLAKQDAPMVHWTKGAEEWLVEKISALLAEIDEAEEMDKAGTTVESRKSFGHRRELKGIVDLAAAYSRAVASIGQKNCGVTQKADGSFEIDASVVQRLWKPSVVDSTRLLQPFKQSENGTAKDMATDDVEAEILKVKFISEFPEVQRGKLKAASAWKTDFLPQIKTLTAEERAKLLGWVRGNVTKGGAEPFQSAFCRALAGSGKTSPTIGAITKQLSPSGNL